MTVDGLRRLTQVVEDPGGLNYVTSYSYDALDDLTQVTQCGNVSACTPNTSGSQNRSYQYTSLGRMSQSSEPEPGTRSYLYDAGGNLWNTTGGRKIARGYTYDAFDRLTSITYWDNGVTPTVAYTYDGANVPYGRGQLAQVSNANSSTSYLSYDPYGRVTSSAQLAGGQSYTFAYSYNLAGALTNETYPSGRVLTKWLQSGEPADSGDGDAAEPGEELRDERGIRGARGSQRLHLRQ